MRSKAQAMNDFKSHFDIMARFQDYSTVFNAFLDFALYNMAPYCADQMKEEIARLDKYNKDLSPDMAEMFLAWVDASDNDGEGFYDALGDLFMDCISFGRNGQFFTPQEICDMMAIMTIGADIEEGKSVCDPACGSGRTLIAAAKIQRRLRFYGADNDLTCAKMCALNMLINSMKGEVAWMNTLTMEHYRSYHISLRLMGTHYVPFLAITGAGETGFIQKLQATLEAQPVEQPAAASDDQPIVGKKNQILLFT